MVEWMAFFKKGNEHIFLVIAVDTILDRIFFKDEGRCYSPFVENIQQPFFPQSANTSKETVTSLWVLKFLWGGNWKIKLLSKFC